jgi:hypothetical protein
MNSTEAYFRDKAVLVTGASFGIRGELAGVTFDPIAAGKMFPVEWPPE